MELLQSGLICSIEQRSHSICYSSGRDSYDIKSWNILMTWLHLLSVCNLSLDFWVIIFTIFNKYDKTFIIFNDTDSPCYDYFQNQILMTCLWLISLVYVVNDFVRLYFVDDE
jgi:hypothetical protein